MVTELDWEKYSKQGIWKFMRCLNMAFIKNIKWNIDYLFVVWLKALYDTRNTKVIVPFSTIQSPGRNYKYYG